MLWKLPPRIKVYEALGAIADNRVKIIDSTYAQITSSSGNKTYDVTFEKDSNTISCNDNGSYWQGYLGYPALAFLMLQKALPFSQSLSNLMKGIAWKAVNQEFKNDFTKTENYLYTLTPQTELENLAQEVLNALEKLQLHQPKTKPIPPKGW